VADLDAEPWSSTVCFIVLQGLGSSNKANTGTKTLSGDINSRLGLVTGFSDGNSIRISHQPSTDTPSQLLTPC
jgi:hypothetical protein